MNKENGGNLRLFLGCFVSLIATAFGFIVRASLLNQWMKDFDLGNEQVGYILGAGLYPFAISIILFSLFIDRLGYGRAMVFAFVAHLVSTIMTIFANSFLMLYAATFLYALGNGTVEAVINPVVATEYGKNKTHWLNILHAGWPGGLVLGGLLSIAILYLPTEALAGFDLWRVQMAILLAPTALYGILLVGQKFPQQERAAAGVSYMEMLQEFGWGSCFIVSFLLLAGLKQILLVVFGDQGAAAEAAATASEQMTLLDYFPMWGLALAAVVPTIAFGLYVKSFGRPMFVFLLLVMFLLATTELGTDGWIIEIMQSVLKSPVLGTMFLIYTSAIMFVLRFFAGPIVHRISPLGLLAASAAVACAGLIWLANAGNAVWLLFAAATVYGFGKTFFWPTTLGVVSEQYPKGGALMLNAIAGVGMLAVGTIGVPALGTLQDLNLDRTLREQDEALHAQVTVAQEGLFVAYNKIDEEKLQQVSEGDREQIDSLVTDAKQYALQQVAVLPAIMFVCYMVLIIYFQSRGGYKAEVLTGHKAEDEEFTGGVEGPVE
jgi:MFS family permease